MRYVAVVAVWEVVVDSEGLLQQLLGCCSGLNFHVSSTLAWKRSNAEEVFCSVAVCVVIVWFGVKRFSMFSR